MRHGAAQANDTLSGKWFDGGCADNVVISDNAVITDNTDGGLFPDSTDCQEIDDGNKEIL